MVSEDERSGDCDARVGGDNGTMKKVVVVLGATGTGKTKASIELAAEVLGGLGFGCEIVNCDALQCYEGSPVSTNKASEEEMAPPQSHWASQKRCESPSKLPSTR